ATARDHRSQLRVDAAAQDRECERGAPVRYRGNLGATAQHEADSQLRPVARRSAAHDHAETKTVRDRAARGANARLGSSGHFGRSTTTAVLERGSRLAGTG